MARTRFWLAAGALVAAFLVLRVALLATSLDANTNWEEPVFAFSAGELSRDGLSALFDHQDDLRHGGGLVLTLLGVPWLGVAGGSLMAFKGLAIVWSLLALCATVAVAHRYFSPTAALLWGTFYTAGSAASARLDVTLVGSHPEALLPCAAAIAAYLEQVRSEPGLAAPWLAPAFGFACAASVWFAYVSLVFVAPLGLFWLLWRPGRRALLAASVGGVVGALPWLVQNLWLRPYGGAFALAPGEAWLWSGLVSSFGSGDAAEPRALAARGALLLAAGLAFLVALARRVARAPRGEALSLAPFLVSPVLGVLLIWIAEPPFYPWDGYYNLRYFVPVQAALYWVLALGLDRFWPRSRRGALAVAATVFAAHGVWVQAGLLGRGSERNPGAVGTRLRGCLVYGHAEADRAPDAVSAVARLRRLEPERCRKLALEGLGRQLSHGKLRPHEMEPLRELGDDAWIPICQAFNQHAEPGRRLRCFRHLRKQGDAPRDPPARRPPTGGRRAAAQRQRSTNLEGGASRLPTSSLFPQASEGR